MVSTEDTDDSVYKGEEEIPSPLSCWHLCSSKCAYLHEEAKQQLRSCNSCYVTSFTSLSSVIQISSKGIPSPLFFFLKKRKLKYMLHVKRQFYKVFLHGATFSTIYECISFFLTIFPCKYYSSKIV